MATVANKSTCTPRSGSRVKESRTTPLMAPSWACKMPTSAIPVKADEK